MLVAYVAHQARVSRPASDGGSTRAYLEASAARGDVTAMRQLHGPAFPDALEYLADWFGELCRARPQSVHGVAPVTYEQVSAWAQLTGRSPEPHEVSALLELDQAYRGAFSDEPAEPATATPAPIEAWPVKKRPEATDG